MRIEAVDMDDYISKVPEDRTKTMKKLKAVIEYNLPKGFEEAMSYGMPGWVVPHSLYPAGYHVKPEEPLPFISIASQKQFVAVYHMGIYSDPKLLKWFTTEYARQCERKLDMGKSCIRFKKIDEIPFELIGELASKMSADQWISTYEAALNKLKNK
jgi:uncharacterized protein YdhG (YjbR/CyaY superfamily)